MPEILATAPLESEPTRTSTLGGSKPGNGSSIARIQGVRSGCNLLEATLLCLANALGPAMASPSRGWMSWKFKAAQTHTFSCSTSSNQRMTP